MQLGEPAHQLCLIIRIHGFDRIVVEKKGLKISEALLPLLKAPEVPELVPAEIEIDQVREGFR